MIASSIVEGIKRKYDLLKPELDERGRRLWAVSEARGLGHGGIAAVARATGLSELTIRRGRKEGVGGGAARRARVPSHSATGRRPQGIDPRRSRVARGARCLGGTDRAGGSAGALTLDV